MLVIRPSCGIGVRLSSNLVIGVSVSLMQGTMPEAVDNLKHGVSADGCHTLRICGIVAGWLKMRLSSHSEESRKPFM